MQKEKRNCTFRLATRVSRFHHDIEAGGGGGDSGLQMCEGALLTMDGLGRWRMSSTL